MLLLLSYIVEYVHTFSLLSQQPSPSRHLPRTLQQSPLLASLELCPPCPLHQWLVIFLEHRSHHIILLLQTVQWVLEVLRTKPNSSMGSTRPYVIWPMPTSPTAAHLTLHANYCCQPPFTDDKAEVQRG